VQVSWLHEQRQSGSLVVKTGDGDDVGSEKGLGNESACRRQGNLTSSRLQFQRATRSQQSAVCSPILLKMTFWRR
jgi:hypothetical protein